MIERYARKEIKRIWEDHNRYSIWLNIELAAAEAMEKLRIIPKGVVKKVRSKAKINPIAKQIKESPNNGFNNMLATLLNFLEFIKNLISNYFL